MLVVMGPTLGVPVNLLYSAAFGLGSCSLRSTSSTRWVAVSSTRSWSAGSGEDRITDVWVLIRNSSSASCLSPR